MPAGWTGLMCARGQKGINGMWKEWVRNLSRALLRVLWIMSFIYSVVHFLYGAWAYGVGHELVFVKRMVFSAVLLAVNIVVYARFRSFFLGNDWKSKAP
jgi:hypothetical protein